MFKLGWASRYLVAAVAIAACAPTPNNISLNLQPGVCVSSVANNYEATATTYSQAFPANYNLPVSSPYCMAVTLQNNNSGTNANNVQVYQSGLTLSMNYGGTSLISNMVDFNAAAVPQSSFGYAPVQQLGNLALFDPNNCVTTIGPHVNTLSPGGGQCTFYLQLVGESLPVGQYQINLNVTYANGNTGYTVANSLVQAVNFYLGGNLTAPSSNLAVFNGAVPATSTTFGVPTTDAISALTRDSYGNLFIAVGSNLYLYNGHAWTNVPAPTDSFTQINALTSDSNGNIYAATNNGVWAYAMGYNVTPWTQLPNSSGNSYLGVQVQSFGLANNVFAAYNSGATSVVQSCTFNSPATPGSCSLALFYTTSETINANTFAVGPGPLVSYANSESLFYYGSNVPIAYVANGYTPSAVLAASVADSVGMVYAGYNNSSSNLNNLAIAYSGPDSESNLLQPLNSTSGASLTGAVTGVYVQNATQNNLAMSGLFIYGSSLASLDFSGESLPLAYLSLSYQSGLLGAPFIATSQWLGITGITGTIAAGVSASALVTQ